MQLPDRLIVRSSSVAVPASPVVPPLYPAAAPANTGIIDLLLQLWRQKTMILSIMLVFTCIAIAAARFIPVYYLAEARVLVGVPIMRVMNIEAVLADMSPDAERIQNEGYVVQSRAVAERVVSQLDLVHDPEFNPLLRSPPFWHELLNLARTLTASWLGSVPDQPDQPVNSEVRARHEMDLVIDTLLAHLDVSPLGRSHVLSIEVKAKDPDRAALIANAFSDAYLARQRLEKVRANDEAEKFLTDRIAMLRQQVEKADEAVEEYRRQNGLYKATNASVTTQQLTELNTQLIVAQTAKAEADARLGEAQALKKAGMTGESVPEVLSSPVIHSLKQQQVETERRLADLSGSFGPQHPRIVSVRAEVAGIRSKLKQEVDNIVAGLRHEARTSDARYQALRQSFDRLQSRQAGVNAKSIKLESLEREAAVNHNLLDQVMGRAKETFGQDQLQRPNGQLISAAAPPTTPGFPPRLLIVFLGALGGGLIGVMIALLRDSADRSFRRSDQLEDYTGLPVLALVPALKGRMTALAHVMRHPFSPYSEALRKLYIGLELSQAKTSPKTVLFASAVPGEGKSVLVASFGRLLASQGHRILLIDCDWRSPRLHRLLQCSNRRGLADLICADDEQTLGEVIFTDTLSGVDVIPAGQFTAQSMRNLGGERMRQLLQSLSSRYDMILLDAAPVLVGADILTLARMVDKVTLSVRWGHTRREAVGEALKSLIDVQADFAGAVLTRVDPKGYRRYAYGHLNYEYERPALARSGNWS
jgi:succinoglycan biosynthesis transport protein ExoP